MRQRSGACWQAAKPWARYRLLKPLTVTSCRPTAAFTYFSLKNDNQLLNTQIEVLKIQIRQLDRRLDNIENRHADYTPQISKIKEQ
jgi:hypothetical protein